MVKERKEAKKNGVKVEGWEEISRIKLSSFWMTKGKSLYITKKVRSKNTFWFSFLTTEGRIFVSSEMNKMGFDGEFYIMDVSNSWKKNAALQEYLKLNFERRKCKFRI